MSNNTTAPVIKKIKPRLTEAQLQHALQRLNQIYTLQVRPLNNISSSGAINWEDNAAVDAFVKKHSLPTVSWGALGSILLGRSMSGDPYKVTNAFNKAIADETAFLRSKVGERVAQCTLALTLAQDELIFNMLKPDQLPGFLETFEKKLKGIVTGVETPVTVSSDAPVAAPAYAATIE